MVVCFFLSFPLGVATAVYLEGFAPKNKITEIIEININNLAAVPSVVFGILGLAIFIGVFGMPRSIPLIGGMVLAIMTLPTIIIFNTIILPILMGCFVCVSSTYIFGTLLTANGNLYHLNLISVGGVIINIFLNLILIPKHGALGSAIASLVTQFLVSINNFFFIWSG